MTESLFPANRVNGIMRLYLPFWRYEERVEELVRFCHETGIRHVMLVTLQEIAWNQLNEAEIERETKTLRQARERLARDGIRLGVNITYNMPSSLADHRGHNDYDYWTTYADGTTDYRIPCLLDPKFDRFLETFFTRLARIGPDYIFVDDDHCYKFLGHKGTWGCFCDLHLRRFAELTGRSWTRETLAPALLNDREVRSQWIDFLGQRLVEVSALMRRTVHAVNPGIAVGEMVPCAHCLPPQGHTVRNVLDAFTSDRRRPLIRPSLGPYQDHNRRHIIPALFYIEYVGSILGDEIDYVSEIETHPYSRLSKSLTVTRFQVVQTLLNRMNNPSYFIGTCSGDSPFFEPAYVEFLKSNRAYFEAVRRLAPRRGTRKGIQFFWDFASAKLTPAPLRSIGDLFWPSFACHDILGNLGFPITYDESPIRFLAGDSLRALSRERLEAILAGGVMLDVPAARALADLGFAADLGCQVEAGLERFGGEECVAPDFCGPYVRSYIPLNALDAATVFRLNPAPGAQAISHIVDHDLKRMAPGVVLYRNERGGRVCVLPFRIDPAAISPRHLVCYQRQAMLKRIFEWMQPGVVAVTVEEPSDFAVQVWEDGPRLLACLTNLSFDVAREITVQLARPGLAPDRAFTLGAKGRRMKLAGKLTVVPASGGTVWKIKGTFNPFDPFLLISE